MAHDHLTLPLAPGTRVRVRQDRRFPPGPWPAEPSGTIDHLPSSIQQSQRGPLRMYWVMFDEPQFDVEGDTAYIKAEVAHIYVEVDPDLDAASSNSSGDIGAR